MDFFDYCLLNIAAVLTHEIAPVEREYKKGFLQSKKNED